MRSLKVLSEENPREIAGRVLGRAGADQYVEDLLDAELSKKTLSGPDRSLCQELVYGVMRNRSALDWLIGRKTGGRDQKPVLRTVLQLGLYQVFWMDRIPGHAAANETVEMAKRSGFGPQAGFVNALLRGYLREVDATRQALAELKRTEPWTAYSHPEWLVRRWTERWGAENTTQLLEWNNHVPENYATVNTLKTDPGALLERWREENVDYDFARGDWLEENSVFKLRQHPPLHRLNSFNQGWFYVQDPSTLFSVRELEVSPGLSVLDLCAAPGGKLIRIAQALGGQGELVGADVSEGRLQLARENCARMGVTNASLVLNEGEAVGKPNRFDRVLLDAPCSNTGVLRRRVDLRWRIKPEEITRIRRTQLKLLEQAAGLLRPGGILVYSTCSLETEENGGVAREFLSAHSEMRLERERTLLPFVEGVDGAYAARLLKSPAV